MNFSENPQYTFSPFVKLSAILRALKIFYTYLSGSNLKNKKKNANDFLEEEFKGHRIINFNFTKATFCGCCYKMIGGRWFCFLGCL